MNQTNTLITYVDLRRQPQLVNRLRHRVSLADALARWPQRSMRHHPFFSFLLLKMRKRNIGNELSCDGLFHFLITVSLPGKGRMNRWPFPFSNYCLATQKRKHGSHECFFPLVNVLYNEHRYQSTSDGYKYHSHWCFLIIANRKMNRGWFGSLFVFSIEWHQTGKQGTK